MLNKSILKLGNENSYSISCVLLVHVDTSTYQLGHVLSSDVIVLKKYLLSKLHILELKEAWMVFSSISAFWFLFLVVFLRGGGLNLFFKPYICSF